MNKTIVAQITSNTTEEEHEQGKEFFKGRNHR